MLVNPPPSPQTGLDALAQAWLGAGATAVSIWDHHRLIRHWPAQISLDTADFVTPIRLGNNGYGEMRISGFGAPGLAGWYQPSTPDPFGAALSQNVADNGNAPQCHHSPAKLHGLDVFADSRPSLEAGGDYYNLVYEPSGTLAFSVADVAGKGLRAAMFVPEMHRLLRDCLQSTVGTGPHELLKDLNNNIYPLFAYTSRFATALLGCYDPSKRTITYANAGHSPVIYRTAAGEMRLLRADCVPLGIQRKTFPAKGTVNLDPGDILVIATDGIAEAKSATNELYGYQRLSTLIDSLAGRTAHSIVRLLFQQVAAFTGSEFQDDDQTVMVLKGTE